MKEYVKNIPIPICGLGLGVVALGNLLAKYDESFKYICVLVASLIVFLVVLKTILFFQDFKKELSNPLVASVFVTIFMTLGLLSPTYFGIIKPLGYLMWYASLLGHLAYLVWFSFKFVYKSKLTDVLPSWFIVYVGYVVVANTSKVFNHEGLGRLLLVCGFVMFALLFIIISARMILYKIEKPPVYPSIVIYTAPLNLCLVGYLTLFNDVDSLFLLVMSILSLIIFIYTITLLPKIIKSGFYPSYSALTFPFVISLIAYNQLAMVYNLNVSNVLFFLTIIVVVLICFVLYKYLVFIKIQTNKGVI